MYEFGLKTQELTNLGPLVVLAGPNGGRKTRYLKLVDDAARTNDSHCLERREARRMSSMRAESAERVEVCFARALVIGMDEIRQLRHRTDDPHRAGRRHAFLAMLHLNATMAQEIYPPP